MNARQKAKKYKRAYELLLREKPHIVFHEVPCPPMDTLNFSQLIPKEFVEQCGKDYIREVVVNSFAKELAKCPEKYIDYYAEYIPYMEQYRLNYQMKVLRRQPKYEAEALHGLHANMVSIDEFFGNKKENESEE